MRRRILTLAAGVALAGVVGVALACRDDTTAPRRMVGNGGRAVASKSPQSAARVESDARAALQKANPWSWVGAAHNAALEEFLEELRKPGVLTRDICSYLVEFSAGDERIPSNRRELRAHLAPAARRGVAAKALRATELCGATRTSSASMPDEPAAHDALALRPGSEVLARLAHWPAPRAARQSQTAYNLLSQINTAIDYAVDSYDLARRLQPIVDAAASLPFEEYAAIAATASVAQSSFEYWQTQLPAYQQAIAAEYGACADQMRWAGYSYSAARDQCLGGGGSLGGYGGAARRFGPDERRQQPGAALILTSGRMAALRQCPGVAAGFRKIGRSDAGGAFAGAINGAFSGGVQGAILGAILGGGIASTAAALGNAWDAMWYC